MRGRHLVPHMRAYNALIAATGRAFRLGDVADLVADMAAAGRQADEFTFSALLSACQRAEEAELTFDVFRCPCPPSAARTCWLQKGGFRRGGVGSGAQRACRC